MRSIQEELNQKTIALCIKGGKISEELLKAAMKKYLEQRAQKKKDGMEHPSGKQSMKKLAKSGYELSNMEITDDNIRSFNRVASKYGIAYSLKKDKSEDPPKHLVFFKAQDVEVMTAAFKEYAGVSLKHPKRRSVKKFLRENLNPLNRTNKHREREKTKEKEASL